MSDNMSDQEFLTRLRGTALDAAGSSSLDVDAVLRSSRRKHTARRAGYAAAAGLVLSTASFGAAGAIPGVPGLWSDEPVEVSPSSSVESPDQPLDVAPADTPGPTGPGAGATAIPEEVAEVVEVGPGVRQVTKPVTVMSDKDTAVVDLGLGAWGDGLRFFAEVDLGTQDGDTVWTGLRLFSGTDLDLRTRADGGKAGRLLWDGVTNDAMVRQPDGASSLVFGLTSGGNGGAQHLVLDKPLVKGDPATSSVSIAPFDVLGNGAVWLRVVEVRKVAPRGFVYSGGGESWGASWCRTTSPECTVTYDPAHGTVGKPTAVELPDLVKGLGQTMADAPSKPAVTAMETCVATRSDAEWTASSGMTEKNLGTVPDGVPAGAWHLCLIDLTEAAVALQRGLIELPAQGDSATPDPGASDGSGSSSEPGDPEPGGSPGPIETLSDGVGGLLEEILDGVATTVDGDASSGESDDGGSDSVFGGDSGGVNLPGS
ncbi:hypothetical protein GCM10028784_38340 [Myceligenerans cantabricum]